MHLESFIVTIVAPRLFQGLAYGSIGGVRI